MKTKLQKIVARFKKNLEEVETLLTFDEQIRGLCLKALKKAQKGLDASRVSNPHFSVDREIEIIERFHLDEFLKRNYRIMYNQCIVLMVSYLSSTLEDIFKAAFTEKLNSGNLGDLESEELKLTLGELLFDDLGDVFIQKKDGISFQDMKSTLRSFKDYIGTPSIERNEVINNIILAQAMRHCIVHSGCIISNKTIGQLRDAKRTVMLDIRKDQQVQFSEEEVRQVKQDMLSFVNRLSKHILEVC